jgi:hypothetical protein
MVIHLLAPKDQSKWPEVWNYCYKSWKDCPYKIKMWDDKEIDNLIKGEDKEFFDVLNTLPPIYKFDYVRYIILEKFGGAYFDMDVEIVDPSFFKKLNPAKIYIMEGTCGSLVENSIMIARGDKYDFDLWRRLNDHCKFQILDNLEACKDPQKVIRYAGPQLISNFFIKYLHNFNLEYEVLSYAQFGSLTNEISFTRHYQTNKWV